MADKDFKVKAGLDLGTPLPLTEGGTGQTSANNALNAILPVQTSSANKFLQTDGTSTSWVAAAVVNNATFTGSSLVIPSGTNAERPASPVVGAIRLNTDQGTLEFWTGTSWGAIATFPQPPRNLVATDTGTSRAYNNASASIAFDLPTGNGGSTITSYKITSSPGGFYASGSSSPIVVTGLQSNTSYTFTGTATNSIGEGGSSSASSSILATTVPQAPTIGTVTVTNSTTVSVPFTAGANGGKSTSSYTVTASPIVSDISTSAGTSSPLTVTGTFAGSTSYTFTIVATNTNGTSSASSVSNSVIPNPVYSLSQTFNTSGTYTVPANKSKLAAFVLSGGGGGGGGGSSSFSGGATNGYTGGGGGGGGHGKLVYFKDYPVTPGENYSITIGGQGTGGSGGVGVGFVQPTAGNAGGLTSFGNLVSVNGGTGGALAQDRGGSGTGAGGTTGTYSSNISGYIIGTNNTGSGGAGAASVYTAVIRNGNPGSAGDASSLLVNMNLTGLGSVSSGINTGTAGGGGEGGSGGGTNTAYNGGAGGSAGTGSGSGGSGGQSWLNSGNGNLASASPGNNANGVGGAGGGGGGSGRQSNNANGGAGGSGFAGQVVVYIQ